MASSCHKVGGILSSNTDGADGTDVLQDRKNPFSIALFRN